MSTTTASSHPLTTTPKAIASYWVDVATAGGASILFLLPLCLLTGPSVEGIAATQIIHLTLLFNYPHFLASYRLLYTGKAALQKHPYVTVVFPILIVIAAAFIVAFAHRPEPLFVVHIVFGIYVGWHFTRQSWGLTATYAVLDGIRFSASEQWLLKRATDVSWLWFILWTLSQNEGMPAAIAPFFDGLVADAWLLHLVAAALAGAGFYRVWRRTGRLPSLRSVLPLLAIVVWFVFLGRFMVALFWVQIAHSVQYLSFPLRVEANRRARSSDDGKADSRSLFFYYLILVVIGFVLWMVIVPAAGNALQGATGVARTALTFSLVFSACINVHHFLIDGVAWRLRNPEVRRDLLDHVR